MLSEAHITILVSAGSAIVVAAIALSGTRGTSLATMLANEQRRHDDCEKTLREAGEKHDAETDALKADRDKERQRADMLAVQLEALKSRSERTQGKHP